MSSSSVIGLRGLNVTLHRGTANHVLRDVALEVRAGEIVALVGESGSGKSTLGLALQGLLPEDSHPIVTGAMRVAGQTVVDASPGALRALRRKKLGAVFQDPMTSLNPTMRIGRQLREAMVSDDESQGWLERVGIADPARAVRAYPHQLSGGQRQRVMIAMAMANNPQLVIADEPTTALDVTVQAQILDLIRALRDDRGTAFLFITHDLAVAASVADRIAVLYAGRIVEFGTIDTVLTRPAHPYTAALLDARFDLDVDRSSQLATIPGDPLAAPQDRCSFSPRCLLADERCNAEEPQLTRVTQHPGEAACFHADRVTSVLWDRTRQPWPVEETQGTRSDVVTVSGVSHRYRTRGARWSSRSADIVALKDIDLDVGSGESVAVVGESGSGKSTLLRIIAGLLAPSAGTVTLHGQGQPQMVFQDAAASLTPWLTVGELVGERLRTSGLDHRVRTERVVEVLDQVGLGPDVVRTRPAELSGGQQQRVAIARAIVVPSEVLLCDEPVSAMDVSLAASILNLIGRLRRELGMTMLFVTHDLAAARFVADRIIVMKDGRIVEQGPAQSVVSDPADAYTRQLLASVPTRVAKEVA